MSSKRFESIEGTLVLLNQRILDLEQRLQEQAKQCEVLKYDLKNEQALTTTLTRQVAAIQERELNGFARGGLIGKPANSGCVTGRFSCSEPNPVHHVTPRQWEKAEHFAKAYGTGPKRLQEMLSQSAVGFDFRELERKFTEAFPGTVRIHDSFVFPEMSEKEARELADFLTGKVLVEPRPKVAETKKTRRKKSRR